MNYKRMILQLRNLKITIFLNKPLFSREHSTKKILDKLKIENYQIATTVYKHTPSNVHVTGIKNIRDISKVKYLIEEKFCKIRNIRFDCAFLSCKLNKRINLEKTVINLCKLKKYFTSYEPEIFSSIIIKPKLPKEFPTCFLFESGSMIILVGSKSIQRIFPFLNDILKNISEKKNGGL